MIDYDLVDSNVVHCLIQLGKKTTTGIDNLYCLVDFFTTDNADQFNEKASLFFGSNVVSNHLTL